MEINLSENFNIDAQQVMTGRGCVIGQSGSGKSYLVGVMVEELCKLGLPFMVIDTEGEYASIKSRYNAIWVSENNPSADIKSSDNFAAVLSESIKYGIPIIYDLSDTIDKEASVQYALSELYSMEEGAKRPFLVVIEEADKFAPQVIRQKRNMIEEISVRGRKRGIGLLVATQRPANISKNVLAQCSYGFIGKLSIENDVQAIRILFSTQEQLDMLPRLQTGSFLPFGVEGAVETVLKVKRREAVHSGSTPLLSQAYGKKNIPIAELLKEIRGAGKNHEATPVQKQKAPSKRIIHLPSLARRISEADARSIAKKKSRKEFMLFGRETEEIESVSPGYIDAYMMRVLIPSRKRGEYEDSTILMGEGFAFRIDPRQQVECVRVKSAMLAENEARALEEAQKRGRTTTEYIAKKLRIDEINAGTLLKRLEKKGQVRPEGKYYVPIITHRFSIPEDLRNIEDASDAHSTYYHIKGGSRYMEKTVAALFPGSKVMWSKEAALPFYTIVMKGRNGKARVLSIDGIYGMNFHPEPK
jgi:hypothetical protein